jgi:DNA anti-recombination protein RmuC
MAQPNFQNRANAARASAHELELIPNLPAVNLGEQMLQIQETLREIQQTMQEHGQRLAELRQEHGQRLAELRQEHGQRLAELHQVITRS